MALDTVTNNYQNTTSLFRPTPTNQIQSNLAEYYQRTAEFVGKNLQEMTDNDQPAKRFSREHSENDQESIRLNPQGMGTLVDIFA